MLRDFVAAAIVQKAVARVKVRRHGARKERVHLRNRDPPLTATGFQLVPHGIRRLIRESLVEAALELERNSVEVGPAVFAVFLQGAVDILIEVTAGDAREFSSG